MRSDRKFAAALSIAALAVAAAAPSTGEAASNSDTADPSGIISSYLGPLGLRADFSKFLKSVGVKQSDPFLVDAFIVYANARELEIPEGIGGNELPT